MSKSTLAAGEYVLGTDLSEVNRLNLQHDVWRGEMLETWRRAGFGEGKFYLDVGCGPGFATVELARLAGGAGKVTAIDQSEAFLAEARSRTEEAGLQCEIVGADLDKVELDTSKYDAVWCRWVASFVTEPRRLVRQIAQSVAPGGTAAFHEYLDYGTWRLIPRSSEFELFVERIQQSWRENAGEPDIATQLPGWLEEEGLIVEVRPVCHVAKNGAPMWNWPASFVDSSLTRLVQLGTMPAEEAAAFRERWDILRQQPAIRMVTPTVAEIIARRPLG